MAKKNVPKGRLQQLLDDATKLLQSDDLEKAKSAFDRLRRLLPASPLPLHFRGLVSLRQGKLAEGISFIDKALALDPGLYAAYLNRGNALKSLGQPQKALDCYDRALAIKPDFAEALLARAQLLQSLGRHHESAQAYEAVLVLKPNMFAAWTNHGIALLELRQLDKAIRSFDQAIALNPKAAQPHLLRAYALRLAFRWDEALASYATAIALQPDFAAAYIGAASLQFDLKRYDDAFASFERGIALNPQDVTAWKARAECHERLGKFSEAFQDYAGAFAISGRSAGLDDSIVSKVSQLIKIDLLPAAYRSEEELWQHRSQLEKLLETLVATSATLDVDTKAETFFRDLAFSVNAFFVSYQQKNDVRLMSLLCEVLAAFLKPTQEVVGHSRLQHGRRRIGIASMYLRNHNAANWSYNWFKLLTKDNEFFTYDFGTKSDDLAVKFANLGTHRQMEFSARSYRDCLSVMRADGLDVLFMPDIGMSTASRVLSLHRVAPVQCTAWGHPVTSGSPAVDYFLSSGLMEPADGEEHYSEKLVRLPNIALYLEPAPTPTTAAPDLSLPSGRILYGCLQSLYKYIPKYDVVFPRIALEVPEACFVFLQGEPAYATEIFVNRLRRVFEWARLDFERHVVFHPRVSDSGYGVLQKRMDVLMDSVGWSGGNTSLRAIENGIPLVTLPGDFMRGRHTAGMFAMIGMDELIASSLDDYVSRLVECGKSADRRKHFSDQLLENRWKLYEDRQFLSALGEFFGKMVP